MYKMMNLGSFFEPSCIYLYCYWRHFHIGFVTNKINIDIYLFSVNKYIFNIAHTCIQNILQKSMDFDQRIERNAPTSLKHEIFPWIKERTGQLPSLRRSKRQQHSYREREWSVTGTFRAFSKSRWQQSPLATEGTRETS